MPLVVKQTGTPADEPVTVAEAKSHLNITTADDDTLIGDLIAVAREYVEGFTGRQLVTATWTWKLDAFPEVMRPPFPPLTSTDFSIAYTDTSGDPQTVTSTVYTVDTDSEPGRIFLAHGQTWPAVRSIRNAITVTFKAGYGAAAAVPDLFKSAIKLLLDDLYEHRGAQSELRLQDNPAVMRLLWLHRVAA